MKVFIIPLHVKALANSIMPAGMSRAYVSCYCKGATYVEATERVLKKIAEDGLHPEEILQPIHEIEPNLWTDHLAEMWPDYIDSLPNQNEFEDFISAGQVVYGPFGSYSQ